MADLPLERPVPLTLDHDCSQFDCGSEPLNTYLKRFNFVRSPIDEYHLMLLLKDL